MYKEFCSIFIVFGCWMKTSTVFVKNSTQKFVTTHKKKCHVRDLSESNFVKSMYIYCLLPQIL